MRKLFSLLIVFLLLISTATYVTSESGSDSLTVRAEAELEDSDNSGSDDKEEESEKIEESEDESEDELKDESEEDELDEEDEASDEDELDDEEKDEDETELEDEDGYSSGPSNPCEKISYIEKKLFELNDDLAEELEKELEEGKSDDSEISEIKSDIASARKNLVRAKEACATARTGVAVGVTCEISSDLKEQLTALKEKYVAAIEAKDFEESKRIREEAAKLEQKAQEERRKCFSETVPGLVKETRTACEIPQELYDRLEKNRYRVSELRNLELELPEDLKKDIAELESKIAEYKAKCHALKVTSDVDTKDVRAYYAQRMSDALENEDEDARLQELKELRREIDETIKNLVEQKKKLKFSEVDGLVEEVKFKAKSTNIGDSETSEDVEIEVEVEGSTITIESNDEEVVLVQDGVTFTADDITVDENGIYVKGVLVKNLPKAVFENNKNFERNAKNIVELRLDAEDEKAVYKARYESRRKLFGFIGVNANNDMTIDAETGDTISEGKPWWNGLSTEVESEAELEAEDDEDSVDSDAALDAETEVSAEAN